jgi:hypothetical protein
VSIWETDRKAGGRNREEALAEDYHLRIELYAALKSDRNGAQLGKWKVMRLGLNPQYVHSDMALITVQEEGDRLKEEKGID